MSFDVALRARLKADANVSTIVGTRIDWDERPQRSAYPAIVLELASDPRPQNMGGLDAFRSTRIWINCFAITAAGKAALREAVIAAVLPEATQDDVHFRRSFINNVINRSENTETGFVHRDLVDVTIWHDA
jgi:hypothetical protein